MLDSYLTGCQPLYVRRYSVSPACTPRPAKKSRRPPPVCAVLEAMSFERRPLAMGDPLPACSLTFKLRGLLLNVGDKPGGRCYELLHVLVTVRREFAAENVHNVHRVFDRHVFAHG